MSGLSVAPAEAPSNKELGCLICCKDVGESGVDHILYRDRRALKNVLYEIFYHLLIPNETIPELYRLCKDERFCPRCLQKIDDVNRMLSKISTLKLLVQNTVESLGTLIAAAPVFKAKGNGPAGRSRKTRDLWNQFRHPIIQNFASDRLPLPRVILKDCSLDLNKKPEGNPIVKLEDTADDERVVKKVKLESTQSRSGKESVNEQELQTDIKTQEASANIVEPSKNNAKLMPVSSSCHSFQKEGMKMKSIEFEAEGNGNLNAVKKSMLYPLPPALASYFADSGSQQLVTVPNPISQQADAVIEFEQPVKVSIDKKRLPEEDSTHVPACDNCGCHWKTIASVNKSVNANINIVGQSVPVREGGSNPDTAPRNHLMRNSSKKSTAEGATISAIRTISCPKCDYIVESEAVIAESESRNKSCNALYLHYYKQHLQIDSEDPSVNEDGQEYYSCCSCDFKAMVMHTASPLRRSRRILSDQRDSALLSLSKHILADHEMVHLDEASNNHIYPEQGDQADSRRPLKLACNYSGCYFVAFSQQKQNSNYQRKDTLRSLSAHYLKAHIHPESKNQLRFRDIVDGLEKFGCPQCDFKSIVMKGDVESLNTGHFTSNAYVRLVRHYIRHLNLNPKLIGTLRNQDVRHNKNEAQKRMVRVVGDVIFCPEPGCGLKLSIRSFGKQGAWLKLADHHFASHVFKQNQPQQQPFRQIVAGVEVCKCPKCDFSCVVQDLEVGKDSLPNSRSEAYKTFLSHYVTHFKQTETVSINQTNQKKSIQANEVKNRLGQRQITPLSYVALSAVKCPFCDFVAEPSSSWQIRYPSDQVSRMKQMMSSHFCQQHPDEPFPDLVYRRIVQPGEEPGYLTSTTTAGGRVEDADCANDSDSDVYEIEDERPSSAMPSLNEDTPILENDDNVEDGGFGEEVYLKVEEDNEGAEAEDWNWIEIEDVETYTLKGLENSTGCMDDNLTGKELDTYVNCAEAEYSDPRHFLDAADEQVMEMEMEVNNNDEMLLD